MHDGRGEEVGEERDDEPPSGGQLREVRDVAAQRQPRAPSGVDKEGYGIHHDGHGYGLHLAQHIGRVRSLGPPDGEVAREREEERVAQYGECRCAAADVDARDLPEISAGMHDHDGKHAEGA